MNDPIIEIVFKNIRRLHCVTRVQSHSFSGPCFPVFGLNTEIYREKLRKNADRKKLRTVTLSGNVEFADDISQSYLLICIPN